MYFKAMMWYGRLTFRLNDDFETRRALLVTQAVRTATAADGTPALTSVEEHLRTDRFHRRQSR